MALSNCGHPNWQLCDETCKRDQSVNTATLNIDKEINNQVNHPNHYGGDTVYETIKVLAAWKLGFLLGNAVKYLSRAGKKDPTKLLEDLKKARWYLDDAISRLERKEELF